MLRYGWVELMEWIGRWTGEGEGKGGGQEGRKALVIS